MNKILVRAKKDLLIVLVIAVVLSIILPFLPSKYPSGKSMLYIMSYPAAAVAIFSVFGIILAWAYFHTVYRVKKDMNQKKKVVLNTIVSGMGEGKSRGTEYFYIEALGMPLLLTRVPADSETYKKLKMGSRVIIEYSLNSRKILRLRQNTSE